MTTQVQVQAGVAVDATPKPAQRVAGSRTGGRWARDWDACRICGTTEKKHEANGRCSRCGRHQRMYGTEYPDKGGAS